MTIETVYAVEVYGRASIAFACREDAEAYVGAVHGGNEERVRVRELAFVHDTDAVVDGLVKLLLGGGGGDE